MELYSAVNVLKIFAFLLLLIVCDCAKAIAEDGKYRLGSSYIVFESFDIWLVFNSGSINSGRIFVEQKRETRRLLFEVNQIFLKLATLLLISELEKDDHSASQRVGDPRDVSAMSFKAALWDVNTETKLSWLEAK